MLDFDLGDFHQHHKNMLSNLVKEARGRTDKAVTFVNELGPRYYQSVEDFVYGKEPDYWKDPISPVVLDYHGKFKIWYFYLCFSKDGSEICSWAL